MAKDFNHAKVVARYDAHIRQLIPGYELVHVQIQALLRSYLDAEQIERPRILIAGCGTGYELSYLSTLFPQAKFVALDPSTLMLQFAQKRLQQHAVRTDIVWLEGDSQLLQQYQTDSAAQGFDIVLSVLVSHFIAQPQKQKFFQDLAGCIKPGGICLSFDMMHMQHPQDPQHLKYLALGTGLSAAQADQMIERLADDFELISAVDMQQLYRDVGFSEVSCFTQILNYFGFIALK